MSQPAGASEAKCHRLNGLNKKIYFSHVWKLEVQDQGASMASFWGLSSWFIGGHLLALSSHGGGGKKLPGVSSY